MESPISIHPTSRWMRTLLIRESPVKRQDSEAAGRFHIVSCSKLCWTLLPTPFPVHLYALVLNAIRSGGLFMHFTLHNFYRSRILQSTQIVLWVFMLISLYQRALISWLIYIPEKKCVYCTGRNISVNLIQLNKESRNYRDTAFVLHFWTQSV
jgi:hypothetical protein